jgi:hypothetical protein
MTQCLSTKAGQVQHDHLGTANLTLGNTDRYSGRKFYRGRAAWGNFCDLGNDVPERFQARPFGDSLRPIRDEFDAGLVGPKQMTICDDPSHPATPIK